MTGVVMIPPVGGKDGGKDGVNGTGAGVLITPTEVFTETMSGVAVEDVVTLVVDVLHPS